MTNGAREYWFELWHERGNHYLRHGKVPDRSRYREINRGGDRHGALEWSYGTEPSNSDPLTRMVGVGIIPGLSGSTAMVEFWFGARHGDRYIRRPAGAIVLTFDNDWENFEEHLLDSQNAADDLQEDSLTQLVPALLW